MHVNYIKGYKHKRGRFYPFVKYHEGSYERSISFVCVKYSNEFEHNIVGSKCISEHRNQFIVVDNTANLNFSTLGLAINHGIEQAIHDLIVIVHEDVFLVPAWQSLLEHSLHELEQHEPNWLVLGVVGWNENNKSIGRCSDPNGMKNPFWDEPFQLASRIDEQVIILRKSSNLALDADIPSIHNIGRDLVLVAKELGIETYVVNAPSIHKYANDRGELTLEKSKSKKIVNRQNFIYKQHKYCSDEYLHFKWPDNYKLPSEYRETLSSMALETSLLDCPTIVVDFGLDGGEPGFEDRSLNNSVNVSEDVAGAIVRTAFRTYECRSPKHDTVIVSDLRMAAAQAIGKMSVDKAWHFSLPESVLVLKQLRDAFPRANILVTKNSNVELTNFKMFDLDNELGRMTTIAAYEYAGRKRERILHDSKKQRMGFLSEFIDSLTLPFTSSVESQVPMNLKPSGIYVSRAS